MALGPSLFRPYEPSRLRVMKEWTLLFLMLKCSLIDLYTLWFFKVENDVLCATRSMPNIIET